MARNNDYRNEQRDGELQQTLPQAPDAEKGILAAILFQPDEGMETCESKGVEPSWFHIPANGIIYLTMQQMRAGGIPIEAILLSNRMRDEGSLVEAGGVVYIMELATFLPTSANIAFYIEVVRGKKVLRDTIKLCAQTEGRCRNEQGQAEEILNRLEEGVSHITTLEVRAGIECQTDAAMAEVEQRMDDAILDIPAGIMSGIPTWDKALGAMRPGRYMALGARPGIG